MNRFLPSGATTLEFRREQRRRRNEPAILASRLSLGKRAEDRPAGLVPPIGGPSLGSNEGTFLSPKPAGTHHPGGLNSWLWTLVYVVACLAVIAIVAMGWRIA
jgi:hypothetical protein